MQRLRDRRPLTPVVALGLPLALAGALALTALGAPANGAPANGAVADGPAASAAPAGAVDVDPNDRRERLARALPVIQAEKIGIDLDFIAGDELAGRDSPSPGQRIAARYIRARLQRLGFRPGAPDESYFYEYELDHNRIDLDRSELVVSSPRGRLELRPDVDYYYSSVAAGFPLELEGEVVFCGFGRREDFGPEVRGKWALCLDDGRGRRRRGQTAEAAGAAGLLTFPAADYDQEPYTERFAGAMSSVRTGRVSYPSGEERRAGFPELFLTRARGLALLGLSPALPEGTAAGAWEPANGTELGLVAEERRLLASEGGRVTLENVCGFWPGADPERAKEVILVSAHYDHVGTRGDEIFNGADDNGSGTCGLLALAEGLAAYGPLDRSVLLIWVSAEEKGLLGSKAWADDPWLPAGCRPAANINIDMIGRNAPNQLLYTPTAELEQYYNDLAQVTEALAPLEGFTDLGSADAYYFRSDQAEFERLGIPVMFLFTDVHEDYHQPTDTPDKIDTDKARRVVRTVLRMLVELEDATLEAPGSSD